VTSIQIVPPVEIPETLAKLLDEALWTRADPTRVAVNRDRTQSVAVERVDDESVGGYVVRSAGETTWFDDEDQAEAHYFGLIRGTGLSEDYV